MITFDEALRIVLAEATPLTETHEIALDHALGRGMAAPLVARVDNPRFDNSAVDGYGVRLADLPGPLPLVGAVGAGDAELDRLDRPAALRILTGAPVPTGVDAVVMQEDCRVKGGAITVVGTVEMGANIRRKGEEYRVGGRLLPAGTQITPPVAGLMATNGIERVEVRREVRVAVVTTGSELVTTGGNLGPTQIYESNSMALRFAVRSLGASVRIEHVVDDETLTRDVLSKALASSDVVVTTGGVSVGDRDLVKGVLANLGVEEKFWRINIRPGKPVYFGKLGRKLVFGLPGNPVSALVTFHLLVRPALRKMMGIVDPAGPRLPAILLQTLTKAAGRAEFIRGRMDASGERLKVTPDRARDSHMVGGIASADCLIELPAEAETVEAGTLVRVIPLHWGPV